MRLFLRLLSLFLVVSGLSAKVSKLPAQVDTFLVQYCLDCHDKQTMKGDLNLDFLEIDWADPLAIKTWSKALKMIESGEMPPEKKKQPSDKEVHEVAKAWSNAAGK